MRSTLSEAVCDFGVTSRGQAVSLFTLTNRNGLAARITNFGGIVTSLATPDREGVLENIVLAYDTLAEYEADTRYFGALIGRYGNRIAKGCFEIDGSTYELAANSGPNHLHGGDHGFNKAVWGAEAFESTRGPSLLLIHKSEDGEEGYPGTLVTRVRYTLTQNNRLAIHYEARTDKATPVNLTSHCYFNLTGGMKRDVLGHRLRLNADFFTPTDASQIPTGELRPVAGTPFDFRSARAVAEGIKAEDEQIRIGGGYDHNFVVKGAGGGKMIFVARLSDPQSGRVMDVHSTEPGVQFYSGNFRHVSRDHNGLCLETQHYPDSPNQPGFPSTILRPGGVYTTQTVYSFSEQ